MSDFPRPPALKKISATLTFAARPAFAATLILIPLRYRFAELARPYPPIHPDHTDFFFYAADAAMLLTLVLWAGSLAASPRRLALGPRHLWIPCAGLVLAGWISAAFSYDHWLSAYNSVRLSVLFWFYLYVVNEVAAVGWVIIPVGLQLLVQAGVAAAQFIAQRSVGLQFLGEEVLHPSRPGISVVVARGVRLLRGYGLSDHPNILGGCLAFGLLLLFAAYLNGRRRLFVLAVFPSALAALLVTFSRGAWLAFLIAALFLLVVLILQRRWSTLKQLRWLVILGVSALAPYFLGHVRFFGARLNADNSFTTASVEQQALGERIELVNSSMPILVSHLAFGVGLGATPRALQVYYPDNSIPYETPHWTLFAAALETGLLGATSYLALTVFPFVKFFNRREHLWSDPWACTAIALLLCIAVAGLFDYYTWIRLPGQLWQWLAWGLWGIASQRRLQANPDPC